MKIDRPRLLSAVHSTNHAIRELKGILREPHQPRKEPWGKTERALLTLKAVATKLHSITAHSRGRIHLSRVFPSLDEQANFIEKEAEDFILAEAPNALAGQGAAP